MMATTSSEEPFFFPSGDDTLFGLLTHPVGEARGITVLQLWGAGAFPSSGHNRFRTRLARRLAGSGFHVLRIDYRGVGESFGPLIRRSLDMLFVQEASAAHRWIRDRGLGPLIVVGNCLGARTALVMSRHLTDAVGLVLIAPPIGDQDHHQSRATHRPLGELTKRAFSMRTLSALADVRRRRVYRKMLVAKVRGFVRRPAGSQGPLRSDTERAFLQLLRKQIPFLLVYGQGDDFRPAFEDAMQGDLGQALRSSNGLATVELLDRKTNGLPTLEVQDELLDLIEDWVNRTCEATSPSELRHAPR